MKNTLTSSRSAAITSLLLALPFAFMYTLLVLGIEPPLGPLEALLTAPDDQPNLLGSAVVFAAWLLSVAAFAISLAPIVRNIRAGNSIAANPFNLLVAITIFYFTVMFVGSIIADQYPCWIGVPNCD